RLAPSLHDVCQRQATTPSCVLTRGAPRPFPSPGPRGGGAFMDLNRFTEKAQQAVLAAQNLAARSGQQQIEPEHLLSALLDQEGGLAPSILVKAGVQVDALRRRLNQELERLPKVSGGSDQPQPGPRLRRLVRNAEDLAKQFKDDYVSVEHLLLALV